MLPGWYNHGAHRGMGRSVGCRRYTGWHSTGLGVSCGGELWVGHGCLVAMARASSVWRRGDGGGTAGSHAIIHSLANRHGVAERGFIGRWFHPSVLLMPRLLARGRLG